MINTDWTPVFSDTTAMHINSAMFEQSGGSGYVLKPQVMWDKQHALYNKFNPTEKDVEGLHPYTFILYVSKGDHT